MTAADRLISEGTLASGELAGLLAQCGDEDMERLARAARRTRDRIYGRAVFFRGVVEVSNHCQNDCFYCGIRRSNAAVRRYRLSNREILDCCAQGYAAGVRTFVLQGGEDPHWTDERLVSLLCAIRRNYPGCALTLSLGERGRDSYQRLFDAGARRYLLREETADPAHYALLHPKRMSCQNRKDCHRALMEIGYAVGAGFLVGSPGQTPERLAEDLCYVRDLGAHMVGIGPFIPHHQTPFARRPAGTLRETLLALSILRLMAPRALLPATTALETIDPGGRAHGLRAGANVIMINISPAAHRKDYLLYDNKAGASADVTESAALVQAQIAQTGMRIAIGRGDPAAARA